jgi:hypothetical protein
MDDPRRAVGREADVRVDAQLLDDTVSPGSTIGVTYKVANLSKQPIAVAEKQCEVSFDGDSRTITVGLGSEIPSNGAMPNVVVVAPGETKTFTAGATLRIAAAAVRTPFTIIPRLVQIKVSVLRDVSAFVDIIHRQSATTKDIQLSDAQFERWLESSETIFLNPIPVRYEAKNRLASDAAEGISPAYR